MTRLMLCFALLFSSVLCAADVTGNWVFHVTLDSGNGDPTFVLEQKGETLTGMYSGSLGDVKITGTVKGDAIVIDFKGTDETVHFEGKVEGPDKITGAARYSSFGTGTFIAERTKKK